LKFPFSKVENAEKMLEKMVATKQAFLNPSEFFSPITLKIMIDVAFGGDFDQPELIAEGWRGICATLDSVLMSRLILGPVGFILLFHFFKFCLLLLFMIE
jgi:hypothetical protein